MLTQHNTIVALYNNSSLMQALLLMAIDKERISTLEFDKRAVFI